MSTNRPKVPIAMSVVHRYETRRDPSTGIFWIMDQLAQLPVQNPVTRARREFATEHAAKLYAHDLNLGIRTARSA